jgi:very-short-patch-repair endonuclease
MARLPNQAEEQLYNQLRIVQLPMPVREYVAFPPRMFRFDFAWPDRLVAVEIDGGAWTGGRHVRGKGVESDAEKSVLAFEAGWRVMRITPALVRSCRALQALQLVLGQGAP